MYYIFTDATLTTANLHSALASLSDDEVRHVLRGSSDSRKQKITNWIMMDYEATWEALSGWCFYFEKEKVLKEVKKHFKIKLGMLFI